MIHSKKVAPDVIDGLPIAAFVIDKDHMILRWNKALESLTGLKAKALIGTNQHWKAFYKSERSCMADLLVDGKVKEIQKFYAGKFTKSNLLDEAYEATDFFPDLGDDGKWLRFTAAAMRDSSGTIVGVIETLEDITEHRQVEERITRLNLILGTISNINKLIVQENNSDVLIQKICDSLTETCGCSIAWITLLDASGEFLSCAESGLGKGFTPLMRELKRSDFPACVQQALEQTGLLEITDPSSTCAGCPLMDFYPAEGHMATIRLEHAGVVYGILAVSVPFDFTVDEQEYALLDEIASDIAFAMYSIQLKQERAKAEQAQQQESEEYQKTIFETTSLATIVIEEDTTLSMVNKEFENLSGYSKEELEGKKSWTEFVTVEDLKRMQEYHRQRRIDPEKALKNYEFRFINKEGSLRDIFLRVDMIPGTKTSVASLLDVTERKRAQQEIETLLDLSRQAGAETDLDNLLSFIAGRVVEVIPPAEAASIFLYDKERQVIKIQAWAGFDDSEITEVEFKVDGSLGGRILRTKKPSLINNVSEDPDYTPVDKPGIIIIRSQIAVPLIFKKRVIGIIFADNKTKSNAFSQNHLDLLESIGNQLAGVIENARLLDQVREDQKHLCQSEKRYRLLAENITDIVWTADMNLRFTYISPSVTRMLGYSVEEGMSLALEDILPPDSLKTVMQAFAGELAVEKMEQRDLSRSLTLELESCRKDGSTIWTEIRADSLRDPNGQMVGIIGVARDITERRKANQLLRESEEQYRNLFNSMLNGFALHEIICDDAGIPIDYRFIEVNPAFERITGLQVEDIVGKTVLEVLPKTESHWIENYGKVALTGEPSLIENYSQEINKYFEVVAFSPRKNQFVTVISDITERKRAEQFLNVLNQAAVAMGKAPTHADIFNAIANELKQHNISCVLLLVDESKSKLCTRYLSFGSALLVKVEKLVGIDHKGFSFPIDAIDAFRDVVREKKVLLVENSEQIIRQILPKFVKKLSAQVIKILRVRKSILVPLIVEDQVIGMFSVQSDDLTQEDIPIITAFADQVAGAWNKVELLWNLKKTVDGTIRTIAATVEVRDSYTAGHQERVSDLAAAIAIQMGLGEMQVEGIRMAGLIHDLGKINVPAEILSKPGHLSEIEFELIKTHPQVGYDLLKEIEFPWPLAQTVLQHHEKMDGSGYPQGLKGAEMLLEARILAVADVVEAMSTHRPYRPSVGLEKALEQIRKDKGTRLDSEVVNACLKVFEQGYKLIEIEGMFKVS